MRAPFPTLSSSVAREDGPELADAAVITKTPWQEALEAGGTALAAEGPDDIPAVAHEAYTQAAAQLSSEVPSCHLDWALLAAIGKVETDHGRYGGSRLHVDGTTTIPIRGMPLDGTGEVALILDSDGGQLDGDVQYDRAVGPMQFIPGTWRTMGADGNGDGRADPDNIFDASRAAGRYLCRGAGDLRLRENAASAVRRYNQSESYVSLVLLLADRFRSGAAEASRLSEPPVVTESVPVTRSATPSSTASTRTPDDTEPSTSASAQPSKSVPVTRSATPSSTASTRTPDDTEPSTSASAQQ
jgi:hypothetical protein